jgi:PAS domain S-box-containing protein
MPESPEVKPLEASQPVSHAEDFLFKATHLLVGSLEWENTLRAVAQLATQELADYCVIDLLEEKGTLERVAASRAPEHTERLKELMQFPPQPGLPNPVLKVLSEGRSLLFDVTRELIHTVALSPRHAQVLEELNPRSCLSVPLSWGSRPLGVLTFLRLSSEPHYTQQEVATAEEFARRMAFAVEHARLYRDTQRARKERDASLAVLEAFFEASPLGMAYLDRSLRYIDLNPVMATLNEVPREAHRGHTPHEVMPEANEQLHIEGRLQKVLETGEPLMVEGEVPPHPGRPFTRSMQAAFFPVRVQGELLGAGIIVQDVGERKKAEERLHFLVEATGWLSASLDLTTTLESTARLVAEHMGDYCLLDVLSEDGQHLERMAAEARDPALREHMQRLMAFPPPPGSPLWGVLQTRQPQLQKHLGEDALDQSAVNAEHRALMARVRPHSIIVAPLVARGHALGLLSVLSHTPERHYTEQDMTFVEELAGRAALAVDNARLYQRAEQAVAARDEFVAMATHELRTPLTALDLQLQQINRQMKKRQALSLEQLGQGVEKVRQHASRLQLLVDHLLDVSRISKGLLELKPELVDLAQLVRELVARYEEMLVAAGCSAQVHASRPVVGKVDKLRMEQVLTNLLTNAMKYAPGKPLELEVRQEAAEVLVSVKDQGPGIPEETLQRIFNRFERASGKHRRESLGLGLYIARQIARAHGGELAVESRLGQGTRFTLRLPGALPPG